MLGQDFSGKPLGAKKVFYRNCRIEGSVCWLVLAQTCLLCRGASCEYQDSLADQPQVAVPSSSFPLMLRKNLHTHTHTP